MKCNQTDEAMPTRTTPRAGALGNTRHNMRDMAENKIITRVLTRMEQLDASLWNDLLAQQPAPTPFMRHEYLSALSESRSAVPKTGWLARIITISDGDELLAACPVYVKNHSYGEYVFDWAWARAYEEHGLPYYPKGVLAVPFTPVPGTRLLARTQALREALVQAVRAWASEMQLSSLHMLFTDPADLAACQADGWMTRSTVQFHWSNRGVATSGDTQNAPQPPGENVEKPLSGYRDFDDFLSSMTQEKRKKIRQERRKVREAGVQFRALHGTQIQPEDWAFFYRCYERTYLEHGNAPYLTPAFFTVMARDMPQSWLMFIAERDGIPIASSLIAVSTSPSSKNHDNNHETSGNQVQAAIETIVAPEGTAYGRYWGALERVDCLHFEACYYQPIEWCIAQGFAHFEGGAQGEHKMARALLPVVTPSAHWVAHPAFSDAIQRFLDREGQGMQAYVQELQTHSPLRASDRTEEPTGERLDKHAANAIKQAKV